MIRRFIIWSAMNFGMAACGYFGLFQHVKMAENAFLFYVWAITVINTIAACSDEVKASARAKGRSVPTWLAIAVDTTITMALASTGRFLCATAMLWQIICEVSIFGESNEPKAS